ncbi:chaplin family protein [Actinomadura fulvescens]|uniref:Chaplin domain-containing protein n=1 Tax=Actinomadura fulvescens TaxID=46160 RepID=A0ABP6D7J1_9ACTN
MRTTTLARLTTVVAAAAVALAAAPAVARADPDSRANSDNSPGAVAGNAIAVPANVVANVCAVADVVKVLALDTSACTDTTDQLEETSDSAADYVEHTLK